MPTLTLVRPGRVEALPETVSLANRRALHGDRLTIIDNGKPNARMLMGFMAEALIADGLIGEVTVFVKPGASRPVEPEEARAIAADSDVVIAGLGDCGACSACSLHDAVQLEALGVPSALVITDPFQGLIAEFALSLGVAAAPVVSVPHPISSRDEQHVRRVAQEAADAILERLTGSTRAAVTV